MSGTMKALVLRRHGGLVDLQLVDDYRLPRAAEGHVVIRVRASSFNYHDVFTMRGMPRWSVAGAFKGFPGPKANMLSPASMAGLPSTSIMQPGSTRSARWQPRRVGPRIQSMSRQRGSAPRRRLDRDRVGGSSAIHRFGSSNGHHKAMLRHKEAGLPVVI